MDIRFQNKNRGIALIVVMIAVFVLSVLAGAFAYSMKGETKLAMNAINQSDLDWIGRSGVEYARWILGQDMGSAPYDSLNQIWAGGPGAGNETNGALSEAKLTDFHIGDGVFSMKIIELERKENVNVAEQQTLDQVMRVMGADASQSGTIEDSIRDWVDRDENPRINGAESDFYQGLQTPYVA